MKEYVENRNRVYVREELNASGISRYNSIDQYRALLSRAKSISENISSTIEFLLTNKDDVLNTVDTAISTLENKVQIIRESAKFLSKQNLEVRSISSEADISVVDLSRGSFNNTSYSITDRGVIIDSDSIIHLKE